MFALAIDVDELPTLGEVVQCVPRQIELSAQLIEIGNLQIGTKTNGSLGWFQIPQQESNKRGLACAVFPNKPDLVPSQNGEIHVSDDRSAVGISKARIPGFNHKLS